MSLLFPPHWNTRRPEIVTAPCDAAWLPSTFWRSTTFLINRSLFLISDDVVLPDEAGGTPLMQKTYGKSPRSVHDPDSKSPEERLSEAFDALKAEDSDKATPLKVFRTPCKVGRKYQRKSIQFTGNPQSHLSAIKY